MLMCCGVIIMFHILVLESDSVILLQCLNIMSLKVYIVIEVIEVLQFYIFILLLCYIVKRIQHYCVTSMKVLHYYNATMVHC